MSAKHNTEENDSLVFWLLLTGVVITGVVVEVCIDQPHEEEIELHQAVVKALLPREDEKQH